MQILQSMRHLAIYTLYISIVSDNATCYCQIDTMHLSYDVDMTSKALYCLHPFLMMQLIKLILVCTFYL